MAFIPFFILVIVTPSNIALIIGVNKYRLSKFCISSRYDKVTERAFNKKARRLKSADKENKEHISGPLSPVSKIVQLCSVFTS